MAIGSCSLNEVDRFPFQGTTPDLFLVTPLKVYRKEIKTPILIYAKVDTGFTRSLLIGDVLGKRLREFFDIPPDETNETLWALGVFGVPCDVYYLDLILPGMTKWIKTKAYLPQGTPYVGNVVGMELLRYTSFCVRGSEQEVVFAHRGTDIKYTTMSDSLIEKAEKPLSSYIEGGAKP